MLEVDCAVAAGVWAPFPLWEEAVNEAIGAAFAGAGAGALQQAARVVGVSVRLSDAAELQQLNAAYRGKDKPTNVLSFPMLEPVEARALAQGGEGQSEEDRDFLLGDLVIAEEVLLREADEKGMAVLDHFRHLVVHGTLHLLGYDHVADDEAEEMEGLERRILGRMGVGDPYALPAGCA